MPLESSRITTALREVAETEELLIGSGSIEAVAEVFGRCFENARAIVVADEITYRVAGKAVHELLESAGLLAGDPYIFPGEPMLRAEYGHVETLRNFLLERPSIRANTVAVAVGSGTINDLVKLASHESGRRYMVVPTAASVDGYAAFGASITKDGYKQTIDCSAPLAIVADTDVLRSAPLPMTASGYGDLFGKLTSGADWIIADVLDVEPIHAVSWDMVQTDLRRWIERPGELIRGEAEVFGYLFEGLTMSGFAMQAMRKSRPASGTEHLFAHYWEMQHLEIDGVPVSHGFRVSIGTLAATAMMETLFARDIDGLQIEARLEAYPCLEEREKTVREAFTGAPTAMVDQIVSASHSKHLTRKQLRERLRLVKSMWNGLSSRVREQILAYDTVKEMLETAGCPVAPQQIGLSRSQLRETFPKAQMIRPRYTVMDLAYEIGWFEECVQEIFSSRRYL
jgi:glycerol-1-phosphate dehydrogenase [NAD(P)+]